MSFLLKDPHAVLDYLVDWGAEYLGADEILSSEWIVEPEETGGVVVAGSDLDGRSATVKAAGGVPGHIYRLVNQVLLASGRVDRRSVTLRVEKR
jgi:hypothetical protein